MTNPQTALTAYAALLFGLIHENRDLGRRGSRPFFVLESGLAYVQALAGDRGSPTRLEAVSAKSVPAMAAVLSPPKLRRLSELGFQSPVEGRSPNYWQDIEINELEQAGWLAATVLMDVFDIKDVGAIDTFVRIPRVRALRLRNSGTYAAGPGKALESRWRRLAR